MKTYSKIYRRRYARPSLAEISLRWSDRLKYLVLRLISRTWLKKKLYPGDHFYLRNWKKGEAQDRENGSREKYSQIQLKRIKFFEAVEIDDFDRYESVLLKKFKDDSHWKTANDRERLREQLRTIKTSMDSVTHGGEIFYFKFENDESTDLLESAHVGYIKTFESYFILSVEILTSEKFKTLYEEIVMSDDVTIETDVFNSFRNIVKTKIFVSHTSVLTSSISLSLSNLIDDLTHQVEEQITGRFRGMFFTAGNLPRIEHYEVGDISLFKKDQLLARKFRYFTEAYGLEDEKVYVLPNSIFEKSSYCVRVLKEEGHGRRENSSGDLTNYDWVETHFLLQSLALPSTLAAILAIQRDGLNKLKRQVYDYINEQSKAGFFKRLLFLRHSRKYARLKLDLAKCILTFKRFQEEFSTRNLRIFSREPSLDIFKRRDNTDTGTVDKEKDLQEFFQTTIASDIESLNKKIELLEHVFKPIEDLSVYRTNFWLQIISIAIGVLALVLTLDKVWQLVQTYLSN